MRRNFIRKESFVLILLLVLSSIFISGCTSLETRSNISSDTVIESHAYLDKDHVVDYLRHYHHLPPNYLTKKEAKKMGWKSKSFNLWEIKPGAAIGGDVFTNREHKLPVQGYGYYFECDVNYQGGARGAERLIYTRDGKQIYYTGNHYRSFTLESEE